MVKVSVIIPVYNGERYLEECLDSVCGQTLQDIEIICIDDDSTDSSSDILKKYQEKDHRVHVYLHEHSSAGIARNYGMTFATGEYLAFWDCDDFFDLHALEKLYDCAQNVDADICVCGGYQFFESEKTSFPCESFLNTKVIPVDQIFNRYTNPDHYLDFTCANAWNKLFKRTFIEENHLCFHKAKYGEDVYLTVNALGISDRIIALNEKLVTYRIEVADSLTDSVDTYATEAIQVWCDTVVNLERYDGFNERAFANKAVGSLLNTVFRLKKWESFYEFVSILQETGLKKLYLLDEEEGYYYNKWYSKCIHQLYHETPEQFSVFLAYSRFMQKNDVSAELGEVKNQLTVSDNQVKELKNKNRNYQIENDNYKNEIAKKDSTISELKSQINKSKTENKKLTDDINKIRNSWTFKTGKVITWIPRKLRELFTGEGK